MTYQKRNNRFEDIKKFCQKAGITIEKKEEESINGKWNLNILLSDGGRYTIGPHGGLWHYLSPSQREVDGNEWDKNNYLSDSDFVNEIRERRRKSAIL